MSDERRIFTIGYEGRSLHEMAKELIGSGIEWLVDVRIFPHSRKKGFSKVSLGNDLGSAGIRYLHEKDLGTPVEMLREVRRSGRYDFDAYYEHLLTKRETLERIAELVARKKVALMCYERDHSVCHRLIVAKQLSEITGIDVTHL